MKFLCRKKKLVLVDCHVCALTPGTFFVVEISTVPRLLALVRANVSKIQVLIVQGLPIFWDIVLPVAYLRGVFY